MRISPERFLLPLFVSFTLSTAGVAILYYLNKMEDEKRKNKGKYCRTISLPKEHIPIVIGRGGTTLTNIQTSTHTVIEFAPAEVSSSHQDCIIKGKKEDVDLAEEKIHSIIKSKPKIESHHEIVPYSTVTLLEERNGQLLHAIQTETNVKIIIEKIPTTSTSCQWRLTIKGTSEQISNAILTIETEKELLNRQNEDIIANISSSITNISSSISNTNSPTSQSSKNTSGIFDDFCALDLNLTQIFFGGIKNPSQFYVQMLSRNDLKHDFKNLTEEMDQYYKNEKNRDSHKIDKLEVGKMVVCKVSGYWMRAEVIKDHPSQAELFYIDFGFNSRVDKKDIYELRTDFLSLQKQAIECCLDGIKPCKSSSGQEVWSTSAIREFIVMSNIKDSHRFVRMKGCRARKYTNEKSSHQKTETSFVPHVDVVVRLSNGDLLDVAQELIKKNLAVADTNDENSTTLAKTTKESNDLVDSCEEAIGKNETTDTLLNGATDKIDSISPQTPVQLHKIEVIDLTSSPQSNGTNSSNLIEAERNTPSTGRDKSLPHNPFRGATGVKKYTFIPAGAESSDEDDFYDDDIDGFDVCS
ncbi:tudor and KH domain-containing protein homolog isoform X2 [Trichogramma pretiosum]|uniref:tudor and KH domain-containing protein homolog isoform X2 n=1 Tax=Trichogramma pretiosum TaxID=7493 RepID=UPI0006C96837|nr:tudor and KH domain-containing protein homolog isoform X2 [Trichogramma pretiosum]